MKKSIILFIFIFLICLSFVKASYTCKSICLNSPCLGTYPTYPAPGTCWDGDTKSINFDEAGGSGTCNGGNGEHCWVYFYCEDCASGQVCSNGKCVASCTPNCAGKVCGDDGCGRSCGTCSLGQTCNNGQCQATVANTKQCNLNPIATYSFNSGTSSVSCDKGQCIKVQGGIYAYSDITPVSGNTDYVVISWINTASLTSATYAYVSIWQYDSSGKILTITQVSPWNGNDHFDAFSLTPGNIWAIKSKDFKTESNTSKIQLRVGNWPASSTGYSLFGPTYLGLRTACIETNCADGDDDFDGSADCLDTTGECTNNLDCAETLSTACVSPASPFNLFSGNWISGLGCCGNSPLINGDFEY